LKTAAKTLQIEAWLLLTVYKKLPAPYPLPPPTTYRLATIHPWQTDRQTDRRHIVPQTSKTTYPAKQKRLVVTHIYTVRKSDRSSLGL